MFATYQGVYPPKPKKSKNEVEDVDYQQLINIVNKFLQVLFSGQDSIM